MTRWTTAPGSPLTGRDAIEAMRQMRPRPPEVVSPRFWYELNTRRLMPRCPCVVVTTLPLSGCYWSRVIEWDENWPRWAKFDAPHDDVYRVPAWCERDCKRCRGRGRELLAVVR